MFRSAAEMSSSDSDSDLESNDHQSRPGSDTAVKTEPQNIPENNASRTDSRSLGSADDLSFSSSLEDVPTLPQNAVDRDVNVDRHANVMTAALLEFYCQSRAADILNTQQGSMKTFTRHSPEVQYLGKKLYQYKSQFLASHGVLPDGIDKEEMGATRQSYRDNLDLLGLSALDDMNLNESPVRSPIEDDKQLTLITTPARKQNGISIAETTTQFWRSQSGAGRQRHLPAIGEVSIMERVPSGVGKISSSSRHFFESSPVSVPLFNTPSESQFNMSRYSMEFSELRMLGRGSFGEVYHVTNHIDGQDYAVKKIPLSQRRLDQLQFGGQNQLETIMKEIRTLARLEHTNIVRYYGAWVEQAHVAHHMSLKEQSHDRLEDSQFHMQSQGSMTESSMGIVFEQSEDSTTESFTNSMADEHELAIDTQRRITHANISSHHSRRASAIDEEDENEDVESIPRRFGFTSHGQTSTFGETDDIFTDGLSQDQSRLQVQRRGRSGQQTPAVILHIQMSLHPISLASYLNVQTTGRNDGDSHSPPRRHCFHLMPSLRLMLDIVSGVEYLHSKGIVHRDLKPANIFLSAPESHDLETCMSCSSGSTVPVHFCRPRIGDFGLVADISHLNEASADSSMTSYQQRPKIQQVVGTEFYRPPASVSSSGSRSFYFDEYKIDEKLDVYALGVILFELLYGFNTKMERQLVLNDLTQRSITLPQDFRTKVDQGQAMLKDGVSIADSLETCIEGMLKPQSQQRWSCQDVKEHLRQIYKSVKHFEASK